MKAFHGLQPAEFARFLKEKGISRFAIITDPKTLKPFATHPLLEPLASWFVREGRDYDLHEGVFFQVSQLGDWILSAFVHHTCRGQAQGGTRFWTYDSMEELIRDGLRLSRGMTHKNALAGLWWGGGKGVISKMASSNAPQVQDDGLRLKLFEEYGEFVTSLRGCYVTAEDVGTTTADIARIFRKTRFVTCIPEEVGGSGNPSGATAMGVIRGMQAALKHLNGGTLEGRSVAVQGAGNVGRRLIENLFINKVRTVHVTDIDEGALAELKARFQDKDLRVGQVIRGDLSALEESCDILAPCATGAILNPRSIPKIKAKLICGAANNQLEDADRDDRALFERGITYVPDFLVNRMGIVQCADEHAGTLPDDPLRERHLSLDWEHSVYQTTLKVLAASRERKVPPGQVAISFAEELSLEKHPIFGHRGRAIIDALMKSGWSK